MSNIATANAQQLLSTLFLTPGAALKAIQATLDAETAPLLAEIENLKKEVNTLQIDAATLQTKLNAALKDGANLRNMLKAMEITPPTPATPEAPANG